MAAFYANGKSWNLFKQINQIFILLFFWIFFLFFNKMYYINILFKMICDEFMYKLVKTYTFGHIINYK